MYANLFVSCHYFQSETIVLRFEEIFELFRASWNTFASQKETKIRFSLAEVFCCLIGKDSGNTVEISDILMIM